MCFKDENSQIINDELISFQFLILSEEIQYLHMTLKLVRAYQRMFCSF